MTVLVPNNKEEFEQMLQKAGESNQIAVVDFFATWCGPCRMMMPKFQKMADEYSTITFIKMDVDEHEALVGDYDVKVMPTFVFIKDKSVVHTIEGNNEGDLRKALEKYK